MSAQKKTEQGSEEKLLSAILEKGTKRFSKPAESNRILYGKEHGSRNLLAFARYLDPGFQSARHFQLIAEKLEAVESGKIKRLMINMPPGHGKSHLATKIFPIWLLGRNPKAQIVVASYGAALARNFTRWQRNVVESEEYQQIFPHITVNPNFRSMSEWETV
ncbi:MAG TPA: Terminase-like domain protein, partial [Leptospiraceae bacterium]|nr:Terminase-like domain protein [Leptospiraceae bacterium]